MKKCTKRKKDILEHVLKDNHNRGITLIALVITVIVLLILAAVTNSNINRREWNINKCGKSKR